MQKCWSRESSFTWKSQAATGEIRKHMSTMSCRCLSARRVKPSHSRVTQTPVAFTAQHAPQRQAPLCQSHTDTRYFTGHFPTSQAVLAAPKDWTSLAQEISSISRGLVHSLRLSPPSQGRGRQPLSCGQVSFATAFTFSSCIREYLGTATLWSEYRPLGKPHNTANSPPADDVILSFALWIFLVTMHLFPPIKSYRYYPGEKQALRIENKMK